MPGSSFSAEAVGKSCGVWAEGLSVIMTERMGSAPPPTHPSALHIWRPHAVNRPSHCSRFGYEVREVGAGLGVRSTRPPPATALQKSGRACGRLPSDFQEKGQLCRAARGHESWVGASGGKNKLEKHHHFLHNQPLNMCHQTRDHPHLAITQLK